MGGGFVELRVAEALDVVALDDADVVQTGQAEGFAEVVQEVARLGVVGGLFFDENAVHQQRGLGKRGMLGHGPARASGMGPTQPLVWENASSWSFSSTDRGIGVGSGYSKISPSKFRNVIRPGAASTT